MGPFQPTATTSGLTFDGYTYLYWWLTDPSMAGTCRELKVTFDDGTSHYAYVQFFNAY